MLSNLRPPRFLRQPQHVPVIDLSHEGVHQTFVPQCETKGTLLYGQTYILSFQITINQSTKFHSIRFTPSRQFHRLFNHSFFHSPFYICIHYPLLIKSYKYPTPYSHSHMHTYIYSLYGQKSLLRKNPHYQKKSLIPSSALLLLPSVHTHRERTLHSTHTHLFFCFFPSALLWERVCTPPSGGGKGGAEGQTPVGVAFRGKKEKR